MILQVQVRNAIKVSECNEKASCDHCLAHGCTHRARHHIGQGGPLLTDLMDLHCLNQDKLNSISE